MFPPGEAVVLQIGLEGPHLSSILTEDHDWLSLPPSNHTIVLLTSLPGARSLPLSCLYSLTKSEHEPMEKYTHHSLAADIIPPSSYSLGAGFLALTLEV